MWQGILFGCLLTVVSILALPNLFVSKKDDFSDFFKKMILYQGLTGLIVGIAGVIGVVLFAMSIVTEMEGVLLVLLMLWLTGMLCTALLAILGFLLSYNLMYTLFFSKGKKAPESLKKMRTRIMPMQGKIALLGILLGIWSIAAAIYFYP